MAGNLSELVQFFASPEQKALLEQWAAEDDRTMSYVIRKLIDNEQVRRAQSTQPKAKKQEAIAA